MPLKSLYDDEEVVDDENDYPYKKQAVENKTDTSRVFMRDSILEI